MIKMFGILHKRDDISQAQFHKHWRGPHRDHAVTLVPVMQRYVQNHKAKDPVPGFEPPCDGSPEVWVEDLEASATLGTMPEYIHGAFIDEPNFMRVRSEGVLVSENIIVPGPGFKRNDTPTKILFFLKRTPELGHEAFHAAWNTGEEGLFCDVSEAIRFVRSPTLDALYETGSPSYDGVEEIWWSSMAAAQRALKKGGRHDADLVADRSASRAMFIDENRVVWD